MTSEVNGLKDPRHGSNGSYPAYPVPEAPKCNHLPRMFEYLANDLLAGVVVFLVAIPLCLGIALASGAPLFAGLIAGVVGGIVVGAASGSQVSVSGPAAGLTVICAHAIKDIGSYEGFLVAVVLAGMFQVAFGYLRLGVLGEYCPSSVIKGMLSGIGAVIILKQIPHALGKDSDFQGDLNFWQIGGENSLSAIVRAVVNFHPAAATIALTSLVVLVSWEYFAKKGVKLFKAVPGSLVVVILGVTMDWLITTLLPEKSLRIVPEHHVQLPVFETFGALFSSFSVPDFAGVLQPTVLVAAITIAIIASIESILSVEASDKLDPYRRISSINRELRAQGLGNILSGAIGGLPVTSVIVRSSTNIFAGNKTRLSAIFHGFLLFVAVVFFPSILNMIPLSTLAAVLIVVGFKLVSPKIIKDMYKAGTDQFLPFIITLLAILFTDLLTGVLLGLAVGLFFVLKTNHHDAISIVNDKHEFLMRLNKDVSFVNKAEVKRAFRGIPDNAVLLIDGTKAMFIDKDIYDMLNDFQEQARHRNITVELKNVHKKSLKFLSGSVV